MKSLLFLAAFGLVTSWTGCKTTRSHSASAERRTDFYQGDTREFNPAHFEGPFTVAGEWDLDPAAVKAHYKGLNAAQFGSLALALGPDMPMMSRATNKPKYIRELHYMLGNDKVGIRPIPIVDRKGRPTSTDPDYPQPESTYWKDYPPTGHTADGTEVKGSEVLDSFLREQYGFRPDDVSAPLFAFAAFMHPELYKMEFSQLGDMSFLKTENSMTHLGAYIGEGQTRNSPALYHSFRWQLEQERDHDSDPVVGYPANIYVVRPKWPGIDQRAFLNNMLVTLRLLNELNAGPNFPKDYKFDWFQTANLQETLAFYRAWIDPEWKRNASDTKSYLQKLNDDEFFFTYCAEHLTIVLNVAINLVQSEQGYVDVWGKDDGTRLWAIAKRRYETRERIVLTKDSITSKVLGKNEKSIMPVIAGDKLVPLWKVRGIKDPSHETAIGSSLAYPPITNADQIAVMVEQYGNWVDVGPVMATGVMFGFLPEAMRRTGIGAEKYMEFALTFATKMIKHDASAQPLALYGNIDLAYANYLNVIENGKTTGGVATPGLRQIMTPLEAKLPGITDKAVGKIMATLRSDQMKAWIRVNHSKDINSEAWRDFLIDVKGDMTAARDLDVIIPEGTVVKAKSPSGEEITQKNVKYYAPPAVIHHIAGGIRPYASDYLEIKAVATAMDAAELRKAAGPYRQYKVAP